MFLLGQVKSTTSKEWKKDSETLLFSDALLLCQSTVWGDFRIQYRDRQERNMYIPGLDYAIQGPKSEENTLQQLEKLDLIYKALRWGMDGHKHDQTL